MKYSSKTIQLLIRLRDGEQVNSGEFSSAQQKDVISYLLEHRAIGFQRIGRSRGLYQVLNKAQFQEALGQLEAQFKDLDSALELAGNPDASRGKRVQLASNSKQNGASKTILGFTLLADREVSIQYQGRDYIISPKVGLHAIGENPIGIPQEARIVIVENPECLYDLNWIQFVGLKIEDGPYIILCRSLLCESGKLWLESIPNRCYYFGDFDLAGIRIYETEFKSRLGDKISFIVPNDIEYRIRRNGNPELYTKHVNECFDAVESKSGELTELIALLHRLQSGYEQEGYCFPCDK